MPGAEGMCAGWEHSFAFEYLWEQTSLLCEWTALMFQGGGCGARQGPRFSLAWRALVRTALSPGPVWVSQPSTGPAWTLEGHQEDHFYLLASCGFILWESCSVGVRKKTGKMRTSSRCTKTRQGVDSPVFSCCIRVMAWPLTACCWLQVHPGEPPFDLELFYVKYRNLYVFFLYYLCLDFYE